MPGLTLHENGLEFGHLGHVEVIVPHYGTLIVVGFLRLDHSELVVACLLACLLEN